MGELVRFSVSMEKAMVDRFDQGLRARHCPTRSKAISDLILASFNQDRWSACKKAVGIITIVFNHHKSRVVNQIIKIQHDSKVDVVSTQHIHLSHDHCLEIIITRGSSAQIEDLACRLKSVKGVSFCETTGIADIIE